MEKQIRLALRLILSATFLISAYTKAIDFSSFEVRILDSGLLNWSLAPWAAAFFIAIEFYIGYALLWFNKKTPGLVVGTWVILIAFTVYLLVLLFTKGNDINCGCMGDSIAFTPIQAIVKNTLSMAMLGLLGYFEKRANTLPIHRWGLIALVVMSISSSAASIPSLYNEKPEMLAEPLPFNAQLIADSSFSQRGSKDLLYTRTPVLYAFLSMSCSHCKHAASRLGSITMQQSMPVYLVINGDSTELDSFKKEHQIESLPSAMLSAAPFISLAGMQLPSLLIVHGDSVRYELNLFQLNGGSLSQLLDKEP